MWGSGGIATLILDLSMGYDDSLAWNLDWFIRGEMPPLPIK